MTLYYEYVISIATLKLNYIIISIINRYEVSLFNISFCSNLATKKRPITSAIGHFNCINTI